MEIDGLTRFSDQYSRSSDFFKISCIWAGEFSVENGEFSDLRCLLNTL